MSITLLKLQYIKFWTSGHTQFVSLHHIHGFSDKTSILLKCDMQLLYLSECLEVLLLNLQDGYILDFKINLIFHTDLINCN